MMNEVLIGFIIVVITTVAACAIAFWIVFLPELKEKAEAWDNWWAKDGEHLIEGQLMTQKILEIKAILSEVIDADSSTIYSKGDTTRVDYADYIRYYHGACKVLDLLEEYKVPEEGS